MPHDPYRALYLHFRFAHLDAHIATSQRAPCVAMTGDFLVRRGYGYANSSCGQGR